MKQVGDQYGRWVVIGKSIKRNNRTYLLCKCSCEKGTEKYVEYQNLKSGISKSCGCLRRELRQKRMFIHGEKYTRLYSVWIKMRGRCNNPNDINYSNYGGRGIKVCDEWEKSYQAFRDWSNANGYDSSRSWVQNSLDRIDCNRGYSPDNCRWVDAKIQGNNRRNNVRITYNGTTKTAAEWGRDLGISAKTIRKRFANGLPTEKVLFVGNLKDRELNT